MSSKNKKRLSYSEFFSPIKTDRIAAYIIADNMFTPENIRLPDVSSFKECEDLLSDSDFRHLGFFLSSDDLNQFLYKMNPKFYTEYGEIEIEDIMEVGAKLHGDFQFRWVRGHVFVYPTKKTI